MKAIGVGALAGAVTTGFFGYIAHIPGSPGGLSLTGDMLISAIPGLVIGAVIGFVVFIIRR